MFKDIRRELGQSAIAPEVIETGTAILPDIEIDPITREVTATPLSDALGWKYTRFGHSARDNKLGLAFVNEDGSVWQCKVFTEGQGIKDGRSGQYFAPKGNGDVPFLPPLPPGTVQAIAKKHGVEPPAKGESFWQWFGAHTEIPLIITEGGKKALAAFSLGYVALSLYGCTCGKTKEDGELVVKPELLPYVQGRRVIIAFDRDTKPKAVKAVTRGIGSLGTALLNSGAESVNVALWDGSKGKGLDDLAAYSPELVHNAIAGAVSLKDWQKAGRYAEGKKRAAQWRNYTPDIILNHDYLTGEILAAAIAPHLPGDNEPGLVVSVKAPLGGNKTGAAGELATLLNPQDGVLVLSDLNRLLIQTKTRWNDDWNARGIDRRIYHLHQDEAHHLVPSDAFLTACFQSLGNWEDHDFDGKIVFIDEPVSVIRSLLDGDTLKREGAQERIAHKLESLFKRAKLIILLDGNMNDATAELVSRIGEKRLLKIENRRITPKKINFTLWEDENLAIAHGIEKLKAGGRVAFTSDSADKLRTIYEQLLGDGLSPESILILDSDSTQEECPPAAMENPCKFFSEHQQIRAFLFSPAANRGFDIDGSWNGSTPLFDSIYCLFYGVIGVDQVDQQCFRFRSEDIDRHLWAAESAMPKELVHSLMKKVEMMRSAVSMYSIGMSAEQKELAQKAYTEFLDKWFDGNPLHRYEREMRKMDQGEREFYRQSIIEFFQSKGYTFTPAGGANEDLINASADGAEKRKAIKQALKEEKEKEDRRKAAAIAIAPKDEGELIALQESDPTFADVRSSDITRRKKIDDALPGFSSSPSFTPEGIYLIESEPESIRRLCRFAMLSHEQEAFDDLRSQIDRIISHHQESGLSPWFGSVSLEALKIRAYNALGIQDIITRFSSEPFTHETPEIKQLARKARGKQVKDCLSTSAGKDPIKALKAILKPLGFTLEAIGRSKSREYRITPMLPVDLHRDLMAAIARKNGQKFPATLSGNVYKNRDNVAMPLSQAQQGVEPDFSEKTFASEKMGNLPPEQTQQLTPDPEEASDKMQQTATAIAQVAEAEESAQLTPIMIPLAIGSRVWGWVASAGQWTLGIIEDFDGEHSMIRFPSGDWRWLPPSHIARA